MRKTIARICCLVLAVNASTHCHAQTNIALNDFSRSNPTVIVPDSILFKGKPCVISDQGKTLLVQLVAFSKDHPSHIIEIGKDYNKKRKILALNRKKIELIKTYITTALKIPATNLIFSGSRSPYKRSPICTDSCIVFSLVTIKSE